MKSLARLLALALTVPAVVLMIGCVGSTIWNAGDLGQWVRERAVKEGIERESIKLEEWYVEEDGQNVWKGTGTDVASGQIREFAIPVDKVWKPSS